jgi:hypothetical protein
MTCSGIITLASGNGTLAVACVTASKCQARDLVLYTNPIAIGQPMVGSVTVYNGTGNDQVSIACQ